MASTRANDPLDEDPLESDQGFSSGSDDESDTLPCPYCGKDVSELAELCPHCKSYLSIEDAPTKRKPRWYIAVVIALIFVFSLGGVLAFLR